jgi:hypothetical protein
MNWFKLQNNCFILTIQFLILKPNKNFMAIRLTIVIFCAILGSFLEELKLKAQEIKQEKAEAFFLM